MRDHVTRRPMPLEQSILWKPLHDSHYVVASLQPADGGRRKIFIRQQVIARVDALVQARGRHTVGLLLGQLYQCSVTGADYLIVESTFEHDAVGTDSEISDAIREVLAERSKKHQTHFLASAEQRDLVVGWYRGVPSVEAKPSPSTAAVHVSLFGEPWQMTLVVGEGAPGTGGALFLHDTVNSRWFYAPFYELLGHEDGAAPNEPKPTVISWRQYLTAESVVLAKRDVTPPTEPADVRREKTHDRPWLFRKSTKPANDDVEPSPTQDFGDSPFAESPFDLTMRFIRPEFPPAPPTAEGVSGDLSVDEPPAPPDRPAPDRALTDRPARRQVQSGLADAPRGGKERGRSRRGGQPAEKLSIVEDDYQRTAGPSGARRITDDDDTALGDDATRYIDIARAEGFFIAAKFDSVGEPDGAETLWVLNEPYSGMLLAVVAANSQVIDATLHFNLQTDDAGLKNAPFPEHRDPESKTIYVRETCMDSLRARCRRLRATNALLREWKVTPAITFLTPGEWESIPMSAAPADRGAHIVSDLNKARIAGLPAGVRSQFHLSGDEAGA